MLEILISSSVLIVVLALLRLVLRDRISARLQYALWLLALVRLLVPVSLFHSPVSVAEVAAPAVARVEALTDTVVTYERIYRGTDTAAEGVFESTQIIPRWTVRDVARYVWCAGMGIMAVWFLFVNVRLALRLKKSRRPYGYHSVMPVYVAEGIPSPCLFGLFKPSVYLTEQAASDDAQARQIIAHELAHYRHGDTIWALLRSVCLVVWWFDPLVWLAAALSRQDCELACDEGTIKALGENARFEYGRTLVGMARVGARPSDLLCGATTMTTGKRSLKERVARIANAPKMSVTLAVFVLLIVALAVGCTFSDASNNNPEPEIDFLTAEPTPTPMLFEGIQDVESVRPGVLGIAFFDAESSTNLSDTVTEQVELGEFYDFFLFMDGKSTQGVESPGFSRPVSRTTLFFFDDLAAYERAEHNTGFAVWEDGWFEFFHGESGDTVYYDADGSYLRLFEDIIDKWYSESSEAVFVSGEPIGSYDREYWEEVDRELASFAYPADIEVSVADGFDEALPEDDIFGPLTLEDYIYSTDSWQFRYNGEQIANEPYATIVVYDADGRTLRIMDDADALMIEEADGSITWATMPDGVDCADKIRHLLPWARGEYPTEDMETAGQEPLAETESAQ